MLVSRTKHLFKILQPLTRVAVGGQSVVARTAVTTPSGAILPEPQRERFGYLKVFGCIALGLTLGALTSRQFASFLEENELFVPSDDDDDDD